MKNKPLIAALSIIISCGFILWLFSRLDVERVGDVLRRAEWLWLSCAVALICIIPALMTIRWRGVLRAQDS